MGKMIIITPDETINKGYNRINAKSIFLAGTIDNGDSENWQKNVIEELNSLNTNYEVYINSNYEIYNPRRKEWCKNAGKKELEKQILWEQKYLDSSDLIIIVLTNNSKSPISLLELGLYAKSKKLLVFCTDKFYRYDNVRLTCQKYNIPLFEDLDYKNIARKIVAYT